LNRDVLPYVEMLTTVIEGLAQSEDPELAMAVAA